MDANTSGTLYFDDPSTGSGQVSSRAGSRTLALSSEAYRRVGTLTDPGVDDPQATNQAGWFARTYQYSTTIPHAVTNVTPETGSADTYSYDANGNMTCRIEGGVTYTQTYNAENRISSIAKRSGDCATGTILESWSFAYDGDGVRVLTAHFTGTSGTPDSTTAYYMGGAYEVKDGTTKKYYSIAGMMVAVNDGTGLQYLLTDHLGSTVAVTNSSGTLTSQQRYLPFGAPRTIPNSPILGTDFTYTGQRDLGDMGLMDYDARFYSQSLGRFIQPDTIIPSVAIPQTWNRYSYAINAPTKFVDPSGHFIETLFDVAMILVDVADIAKNGLNVSNGAALVLDVAAVIIPGVPAVAGLTIKAAKAANAVDNAMDAAKLVNTVDNLADGSKLMNKLGDTANIVGDFCSFSADTEVSTPEGSKTISAIEVGDYVLAWNETDGTIGYYEVTDTFSHEDEVLTELIVDGEWIETTPKHPFYVEGKGWTPADELRTGDRIRQADGTTGIVWLKWNVYKTQEMYNLTVDTAHTFFVGEGQWLVHNACRPIKMDAIDWRGYPDDIVPRPQGQLYFLDGAEYDEARRLADNFNKTIRRQNPDFYQGFAIHEIQPVKFGGSPTDLANKMKVDKYLHEQFVTPWWNRLQRQIENNPKNYLLLE